MGTTEIILLVIGGLFFVVSFFLPDGKKNEDKRISEEEIRKLINNEMESAKSKIEDMVDETVNYSIEKTERALEKLSNEKIMAVDEYSETVLKKINDNHQEAVFLYDMLNDKDEKLKNVGEEIKEAKENLLNREKELKDSETLLDKQKAELENQRLLEASLVQSEKVKTNVLESTEQFAPLNVEKFELINDVAIPVEEIKTGKKPASTKNTRAKKEVKEPVRTSKETKEFSIHFDSDNDGMKNSNEQIRMLHEAGKTNMQIAKELGLGVGEVKLVIDLYANRK